MRNVKCEIIKDYELKKIKHKRVDTGEIIDSRDMVGDELQQEFFED